MKRASESGVLAVLVAAVMTSSPAHAEMLTQERIAHEIVGKTLSASRNGLKVRLRYDPDGSLTMKVALITGAGTWIYSDGGLCMTLTKGPKRGKTCTGFEDLGNGRYRNSEGLILQVQP